MSEEQQYIELIKALREKNTEKILQLSQSGFIPNASRLEQWLAQSEAVRAVFYNHFITIILDVAGTTGHIYLGNLPIRDPNSNQIYSGFYGLNPKEDKAIKRLEFLAPAMIYNEEERSRIKKVSLSSIPIWLTEEQWQQLADWVLEIKNEAPEYFLLSHLFSLKSQFNCIKFVEKVLDKIGFNKNLQDLFNANELASLNFNLIKTKFYFPFGPTPGREDAVSICITTSEHSPHSCEKALAAQERVDKRAYDKIAIERFFAHYDLEQFIESVTHSPKKTSKLVTLSFDRDKSIELEERETHKTLTIKVNGAINLLANKIEAMRLAKNKHQSELKIDLLPGKLETLKEHREILEASLARVKKEILDAWQENQFTKTENQAQEALFSQPLEKITPYFNASHNQAMQWTNIMNNTLKPPMPEHLLSEALPSTCPSPYFNPETHQWVVTVCGAGLKK